ncbi:unnamed protein product, partial [Prorocentrum cordatum]
VSGPAALTDAAWGCPCRDGSRLLALAAVRAVWVVRFHGPAGSSAARPSLVAWLDLGACALGLGRVLSVAWLWSPGRQSPALVCSPASRRHPRHRHGPCAPAKAPRPWPYTSGRSSWPARCPTACSASRCTPAPASSARRVPRGPRRRCSCPWARALGSAPAARASPRRWRPRERSTGAWRPRSCRGACPRRQPGSCGRRPPAARPPRHRATASAL